MKPSGTASGGGSSVYDLWSVKASEDEYMPDSLDRTWYRITGWLDARAGQRRAASRTG
jgi:hypothetical protein